MHLRYLNNVSTLELDPDLCVGCRMCQNVCPQQVWAMWENKATIADLTACMECSACAMNCPEGAIQVRRGVGCAAAILSSALGVNQDTCC